MLLQMLQQVQQQNQRLLEAPRTVPPASTPAPPAPVPQASIPPGASMWDSRAARGAIRQRILALLQEHPEGLTAVELRGLLRADRSLTDTCAGMFKDGLLRRVGRGRYVGA